MLKLYHKIFLSVIIVLSIVLSIINVIFYIKKNQQALPTNDNKVKLYTNKNLGFSVEYPSELIINPYKNSVSFNEPDGGYWVYNVSAEPTTMTSTEKWLSTQKKGSAKLEGYQPLMLTSYDSNTMLVEEYFSEDIVDEKGNKTNLKRLDAVHIENGMLYTIKFSGTFRAEAIPGIDQKMFDFISSFQVIR